MTCFTQHLETAQEYLDTKRDRMFLDPCGLSPWSCWEARISMEDFYEVNCQVSFDELKERMLCAIKIFLWNNSQFCYLVYGCFWFDSQTVVKMVKNLPAIPETWVQSLGQKDLLEKEMSIHSSILAWRFPWTEQPGGLQSMGSQRVGPNWREWACMHIWLIMLC